MRSHKFTANLERLRRDGATLTELALLSTLVAVTGDVTPIESLDEFEEWRNLSAG